MYMYIILVCVDQRVGCTGQAEVVPGDHRYREIEQKRRRCLADLSHAFLNTGPSFFLISRENF